MPATPPGARGLAARLPARLLLAALVSAGGSSNTTSTSISPPTAPEGAPGDFAQDEVEPGLVAEQYDFETGERTVTAIDESLSHWGKQFPRLAIRWSGLLRVETAGLYRFGLTILGTCDLELDGETLLALRADAPRSGESQPVSNVTEPVRLAAGDHALAVRYAEESGLGGIKLEYQGPDNFNLMTVVPSGVLFHARGPCRLTGLPGADDPPCATDGGVARWALGDGEACQPRCTGELRLLRGASGGAPAGGAPGSVSCEGGRLSAASACRRLGCGAPSEPRAGSPSCQEGEWIEPGGLCTPSCQPGFRPSAAGALECDGASLSGSFSCVPAGRPCNLSGVSIAHSAGAGPCTHSGRAVNGGQAVPHGATCRARCEPGFEPSANLTCNDGQLEPLALFECARGGAASAEPAGGAWRLGLAPGLVRSAAGGVGAWPPWAVAAGAAAGALVAALALGVALPQVARSCRRPRERRTRAALAKAAGPEGSEQEGDTSEDGEEEAATLALLKPRRGQEDPEAGLPRRGPPAAPPAAPRILQSSWRPLQMAPVEGALAPPQPGGRPWRAPR